jgi:hypothetical protein
MSPSARPEEYWRTQIHQIEKAFEQIVIDQKEMLVLDGIDLCGRHPTFRIRCHDLYGPLPDATIESAEEHHPVLDHVLRAAAKLIAVSRARREIAALFPAGAEFMLPTSTDRGSLVGIQWESKTYLAEGRTLLEAYHELRQKVEEFG